jgi:hypothetical protein
MRHLSSLVHRSSFIVHRFRTPAGERRLRESALNSQHGCFFMIALIRAAIGESQMQSGELHSD